jgi:hypothetical protein
VLVRTLFAVAFIAALAETMLQATYALAQHELRARALLVVHDEIAAATTAARDAVAKAVASGADPRSPNASPPPTISVCRLRVGKTCALEGRASVAFTVPVSGTPSPCPRDACATYEQENDAVSEGRVDAAIAAQAVGPDGAVLAARAHNVAFRTMRVAPFATLAGQSDATSAEGTSPGDDAGAAPFGATPGTLIDVRYRNAVTGATMPANVWRSQVEAERASAAWKP